jgi:hypothetical protein
MSTIATTLGSVADRMLAALVPNRVAHANRYICVWSYGCGYVSGCSGHLLPKLGRHYSHCCWDDYTGQLLWCDSEYDSCADC